MEAKDLSERERTVQDSRPKRQSRPPYNAAVILGGRTAYEQTIADEMEKYASLDIELLEQLVQNFKQSMLIRTPVPMNYGKKFGKTTRHAIPKQSERLPFGPSRKPGDTTPAPRKWKIEIRAVRL